MKQHRTIVFASHNSHKVEEMRRICGPAFNIVSLADIGCHTDIPEEGATLAENAEAKAMWVYRHYGLECFADDTGLEVDALDGAPGVHTARFAGPSAILPPMWTCCCISFVAHGCAQPVSAL